MFHSTENSEEPNKTGNSAATDWQHIWPAGVVRFAGALPHVVFKRELAKLAQHHQGSDHRFEIRQQPGGIAVSGRSKRNASCFIALCWTGPFMTRSRFSAHLSPNIDRARLGNRVAFFRRGVGGAVN
jgi:hypothetical protein